ncbi:MAG: hypothetical protein KC912_24605 [Proteobacteria bacterium]|nr:hypothetical protein [Pseudomonadota bacterium]
MYKLFFAVLAILTFTACGTEAMEQAEFEAAMRGNPNAQICGGIAALQCPDGYECQITESYPDAAGTCKKAKGGKKDCHPRNQYVGTPDECMVIRFFCEEGTQHFSDECGCGCEPIPEPIVEPEPEGEVCGDTVCGEGLECCNASCGICVEPGNVCIQLACVGDTGF